MRVLLTAFGPYDDWPDNASWRALVRLTAELPQLSARMQITTRRYPVEVEGMRRLLSLDLAAENQAAGYDIALHLGQAPGATRIGLESIGLNVAPFSGNARPSGVAHAPLVPGGPIAYQSSLPLAAWAKSLNDRGIPAHVSFHAGTYLCNATLYYSLHLAATRNLATRAAFIHLPLDVTQTIGSSRELAAMPTETAAAALQQILSEIG